ncbi:MAG: multicopper oxidase domain-containing protein [Bacteroidota bacterium]
MKKGIRLILCMLITAISAQSQNQLFIPDTLSGTSIALTIQNGSRPFYPGNVTQTMGINGNMLAPTLILRKHQFVSFSVANTLSDTTTIHWHGMHVAPENDGGPHIIIKPGATWTPTFEVLDPASTHWYHPHLHHKTYDHVQMGISGFIIVRDSQEAALNLPRTYGVDDIPLAIQTKGIDGNNQIVTAHTALDTALMVNGTLRAYYQVPSQVIRLRLLNGSPERVYNVGFSSNLTFYQIGGDGGLLTAPVALTRLLLSPGERAEILINLSGLSGQTVNLMNYGSEIPSGRYGAAQPGMGPGQTIPNYTSNPLNGTNFNILALQVTPSTSNPVTSIPTSLITHFPWPESSANATRTFTFMSSTMGPTAINGPFMINNQHFDMNVINERVPFNNVEIWELRNQTPIAHPFHIHNVPFYILSINGAAPPENMRGKKDVVLVPGGNSVVRFITKFETFYNDTLPYMYHCHMLTHEDDGMMGQFVVNSPCNTTLTRQPDDALVGVGNTATFGINISDTSGATYQWQSNIGFGFQNLQNIGQYSGVHTNTLTVSGVSLSNNNQPFRCIIKKGECELTSTTAVLNVINTGTDDRSIQHRMDVFPNPAINYLYIPEKLIYSTVTIAELTGRIIETYSNIENAKLSVEQLVPGMYVITATDKSGKYVARFIKN